MKASIRISVATVLTSAHIFTSLLSASAATPPPSSTQPEPLKVEVPATAGPRNPVKIATVSAGQKIAVSIGRVLWKGGGTKTGDSVDYRGYRNRLEKNSLPWMALVFAVGKQTFLPDKKEFTFTAPTDGDLVAFANDTKPDGNSGKGEATVTIAPK